MRSAKTTDRSPVLSAGWSTCPSTPHAVSRTTDYNPLGGPAQVGSGARAGCGTWPVVDPVEMVIDDLTMRRLRRLVRSYIRADARSKALATPPGSAVAKVAWRRVSWSRRMLRCDDLLWAVRRARTIGVGSTVGADPARALRRVDRRTEARRFLRAVEWTVLCDLRLYRFTKL